MDNLFETLGDILKPEFPTVIERPIKSWKQGDTYDCPQCNKKLIAAKDYTCNDCNIKVKSVMKF